MSEHTPRPGPDGATVLPGPEDLRSAVGAYLHRRAHAARLALVELGEHGRSPARANERLREAYAHPACHAARVVREAEDAVVAWVAAEYQHTWPSLVDDHARRAWEHHAEMLRALSPKVVTDIDEVSPPPTPAPGPENEAARGQTLRFVRALSAYLDGEIVM